MSLPSIPYYYGLLLATFGFVQVKWESIFEARDGEKRDREKTKRSVNIYVP